MANYGLESALKGIVGDTQADSYFYSNQRVVDDIAAYQRMLSGSQLGAGDRKLVEQALLDSQAQVKGDSSAPGANATANSFWSSLGGMFNSDAFTKAPEGTMSEQEITAQGAGENSLMRNPIAFLQNMGGNIAFIVLGVVVIGGSLFMLAKSDELSKLIK